MKRALRSGIEALLRRLPVSRAAYRQLEEARREIERLRQPPVGAAPADHPLGAVGQLRGLAAADLPAAVPTMRSTAERLAIALRCRDADAMPKVPDAGRVVTDPDGTAVQIMHNGLRVVAGGYYGAWMQELIERCRGHHEPQEEVVFAEVLRHLPPRATMIELGGFWSFYSLWFMSEAPGRQAFVVEADPNHLEIGRRNAALNGLRPHFTQAFAGARPLPPTPFRTESAGTVAIPCVTVPDLVRERGIGHLDLLHCDAQGAELEVLDGLGALAAAGRIGWVVVSTHTHHISGDPLTHQRCLATLLRHGATILAEHDVQESFSGDGLILARFGAVPAGWRPPALSYNRTSESLFRDPLYDLAAARP